MFETVRKLGIPLAWNLAGGYQKPLRKVLDIHDNTMRACAAVYLGKPARPSVDRREPVEVQKAVPAREQVANPIGTGTTGVRPGFGAIAAHRAGFDLAYG